MGNVVPGFSWRCFGEVKGKPYAGGARTEVVPCSAVVPSRFDADLRGH